MGRWWLWPMAALLLSIPAAPGWGQEAMVRAHTTGARVRASTDRIVVRPIEGLSPTDFAALHREHGGRVLESLPLTGLQVVAVPGAVEEAVQAYALDPRVDLAEVNVLHELLRVPSDSLYPAQRHLARIHCPAAWDVTTGSRDAIVAVIDSGTDTDHPDLAANLWRNEDEVPGNGLDDDANGYVDDVLGWDFVDGDGDIVPRPDGLDNDGSGSIDDNVTHGTAVAGCIAAAGDNGVGTTGVAWTARIMTLKVFADDGHADTGHIAEAILYAARNGARVINLSLGGGYHRVADRAIREAFERGVVLVVAGGNNSIDLDRTPQSPVSNDLGENMVLGVAATAADDRLAAFSAYGEPIDVSAPGVGVLTTTFHDGSAAFRDLYRSVAGTSFAAPIVAGVAALVVANQPELRGAALRDRLIRAVDDVGSLNAGFAGRMGSGRVSAALAVGGDLDRRPSAPSSPIPKVGAANTGPEVTLRWTPSVDPRGEAVRYDVYLGDAEDPRLLRAVAGPGVAVTGLEAGYDYRWRVVARNESGYEHASPLWGFTPGGEDVYEPDNVPAHACPMTPDGRHQRRRLSSGDADHASIEAVAGAQYEIRTRITVPGSSVPGAKDAARGVDTILTLTDLAGRVLARNDDVDPGRDVASRILWTCGASGTYLVRVTGYDSSGGGAYSLAARRVTGDVSGPPTAPTDPSPAHLSVGNPQAVEVTWRATGGGQGQTYSVVVRDSSGAVTRAVEGLAQPRLALEGLAAGETYAWVVRARDSAGRWAAGPTWRFSVGLTDPYEPDDSPESAGVISPGAAQLRAFSSRSDVDRVRFIARSGQECRATASSAGLSPAAGARLAIVNAQGEELASGLGAVRVVPASDGVLQLVATPSASAGFYRLDLEGPAPEPHEIRVQAEEEDIVHGDGLRLLGEVVTADGLPVAGTAYRVVVGSAGGAPLAGPLEGVTDSRGRIDAWVTALGLRLGRHTAAIEAGSATARIDFTVAFRGELAPPEGESRLRMVTAPVGGAPEAVFGLRPPASDTALAAYLPDQGRYVIHTGAEVYVEPGRGYFLRHADALTMGAKEGLLPDPAEGFVVPLGQGWNMIGNPFPRTVLWDLDRFMVLRGGERVGSLREGADRDLIDPYGWTWDTRGNRYQLLYDATASSTTKASLDPFEGAWIYAREGGLALEIPPSAARASSTTASLQPEAGGSTFTLRVEAAPGGAQELLVACAGEAGVLGAAPPPPPGTRAGIRAEFIDGSRSGAVGRLSQGGVLDLLLQMGEEPGDVTLSWPDLRSLDREVRPVIEDTATGRSHSLRGSASLRLRLAAGESRRLRIAWPEGDTWLRLTIVGVESGVRGTTVRASLSRPASVEARLMNQAGRIVRTLGLGDRGAGDMEVYWDGRDDRGSALPAGVYALELIADAEDGQRASVRARVVR